MSRRNTAVINHLKAIQELMWFVNELEINLLNTPTHIYVHRMANFFGSHIKAKTKRSKRVT